ncbi:MAG: PhoPQ-activated pathogenicity-related family protein [Prevotella sp.]|jgi:PhoPQ-activated pathogenicity-related protein|nr:PhoPQ-activated pathogenicity-related family protein [Prevotella sp.]
MKIKLGSFIFGLLFFITVSAQTPDVALRAYVEKEDLSYAWEIRDAYKLNGCSVYSIFLISQKWQEMLWKHELIVYVPDSLDYDGAMLFITGGKLDENRLPQFSGRDNAEGLASSQMAVANKAPVALLRQVPNQPLYGGLNEDALIAYTLNEFRKTEDYSWPLLFPMVKSATRAMDVVEELLKDKHNKPINRFLVTGASKRGWTTWLTAALEDPRVVAIAPMVIEMLNMPEFFKSQLVAYGDYSREISDYVEMQIPQAVESEFGRQVIRMIDPYSYLSKITIPKLIIMAANDPFWTIDAIQNYIAAIPGEYTLHYVPNAGHNMGDKKSVLDILNIFFYHTLNNQSLPACQWRLTQKKKINLDLKYDSLKLRSITLWQASASTRDLRKSEWTSTNIVSSKNEDKINITIDFPKQGYKAFFVELKYENPFGGTYSISTSAYVADSNLVFVK